jgi:hypothetical protein
METPTDMMEVVNIHRSFGTRTEDGHRLHLKYITLSFPAYLTERTFVIVAKNMDIYPHFSP